MWEYPSTNTDDRFQPPPPPPPPPMGVPFPGYPSPEYDEVRRGMYAPGYYSYTTPTYFYERIIYYGEPPPSAYNNSNSYAGTHAPSFPYTQPEPESHTRTRAASQSHHHHHHHHHRHHHRNSHSPPPRPVTTAPPASAPTPTPAFARASASKPAVTKVADAKKLSKPVKVEKKPEKAKMKPVAQHTAAVASPFPLIKPHPDFQYSKCTGRKKALCIGINYRGQPAELRGCINDARQVRSFLINYWGFKEGDIVLLTDESKNPRNQPTRQNILDAMRWLVRSAKPHDSLFFHYSGHGGQTKDLDGDEIDGYDEVIFPVDHQTTNHITDDEMNDIMVKPLPKGCRLTALFDSCHSGTVLDLPFVYSSHGRLKWSRSTAESQRQWTVPSDVISWSACKDGQTSVDTFTGGQPVGAMSHAFIETLKRNPKQSYHDLLRSIRLILNPKYEQKPQLGSTHPIDTTLPFTI